ncbi:hypothetical protein [Nereida sp. MMG025]|uniref:hypothetical protein n=1 Tax=Nereida sp. MMG025 TaxID=2909981 RepID=UPI001F1D4255|nr:hypothetical protein [Nereida sp. MMG025]MCF6445333.1 hypothetical protein [Nereida sp. MMG025]
MTKILILGSGPQAVQAAEWDVSAFDHIVAINNAWRVRPDWTHLIHPEDFPRDKRPQTLSPTQITVTAADYVPLQNAQGGFVYAGGTMAFTAGYWALAALKPSVMAFFGCDMVYAPTGNTHFYGTGAADPLREDITLRSLEAKASRLMLHGAIAGCQMVNLSDADSRLVFPRATLSTLHQTAPVLYDPAKMQMALNREAALNYTTPDGRYWKTPDAYDTAEIDALDAIWREASFTAPVQRAVA